MGQGLKDEDGDVMFGEQKGRTLDSRNKVAVFDPDQVHATLPLEGER